MITRKIYKRWMEKTQKEKIRAILEELKPARVKGRILDIGCGPGFLEELLRRKIVVAIDTDFENLKNVKGLRVLASGDNLPFKSESFQTIFCIDTVHLLNQNHIVDIERVLSKNGLAVISLFCSKYNQQEKLEFLSSLFKKIKIRKKFIVKTKQELDTVIVCEK